MKTPIIKHHGATNGVTGSCHQYRTPNHNLLIDCGLFQGGEADHNLSDFSFDPASIDTLVITHGHIDHVGRIPWLIAAGFTGPIICSAPTARLLPIILRDALEIHIPDNQEIVNATMDRITKQITGVDFDQWLDIPDSHAHNQQHLKPDRLKLRLKNAGHILGSAYVELDYAGHRTVFSGDLGSTGSIFVKPPVPPEKADCLIIETTYGDKCHSLRAERESRLTNTVNKALANQGTLLIPAFSLGRTQEILAILEDLLHSKKLNWPGNQPLPIILDSPLASELTLTYRQLSKYWPEIIQDRLTKGRFPLAFDTLIAISSHYEHKRIVRRLKQTEQTAIVIAASGMCQGGRITNYLESLLPLRTTEVMFVGFQARGTLGAQLQSIRSGDHAIVNGKSITVQAECFSISGFSAHADQKDLLAFIDGIDEKPDEIRLVHGNKKAKLTFASLLKDRWPAISVNIPK